MIIYSHHGAVAVLCIISFPVCSINDAQRGFNMLVTSLQRWHLCVFYGNYKHSHSEKCVWQIFFLMQPGLKSWLYLNNTMVVKPFLSCLLLQAEKFKARESSKSGFLNQSLITCKWNKRFRLVKQICLHQKIFFFLVYVTTWTTVMQLQVGSTSMPSPSGRPGPVWEPLP